MIWLLACFSGAVVEVHRETAGTVTAVWSGTSETDVQSLCFEIDGAPCQAYTPKGKLYASDWRFGIFSPDGLWVLLKSSKYGPYDVVKVAELKAYLDGGDPYMRASAELGERFDSQKVMCVHHDEAWVDMDTFTYQCGTNPPKIVTQDVGTTHNDAPAAPVAPVAPAAPATPVPPAATP